MSQILIISDTHFLREHDLEEFLIQLKDMMQLFIVEIYF